MVDSPDKAKRKAKMAKSKLSSSIAKSQLEANESQPASSVYDIQCLSRFLEAQA